MSIDYYGDAFRWFVGIVENNSSDPLKLGRVQVRIRGVHSENIGDIPLRDLPWAQPMLPSTEPGISGEGKMPKLKNKSQVVGFFADGKASQIPIIIGSLPTVEQGSGSSDRTDEYFPGADISNITVDDDILGNSNGEKIFKFYQQQGFSPQQAAAFVGNFAIESGLEPDIASGRNGYNQGVSNTSSSLVDFIKSKEGFHAKAFDDYKQFSNGYGTKALSSTEVISEPEAERRLQRELSKHLGYVNSRKEKYRYNWSSRQVDALASFSYNLGPGQLDNLTANGSRRDDNTIANKILLYNKAGGKTLPGLVARRQQESQMFLSGRGTQPTPVENRELEEPQDVPYGLAGWTGARKQNLVEYSNSRRLSYSSLAGQLRFSMHEFETNISSIGKIKEAKTMSTASEAVKRHYLKKTTEDKEARLNLTQAAIERYTT